MPLRSFSLAVAACLLASCESFTEVIGPTHYSASLLGANMKPGAVTTAGNGTITLSWDPLERTLDYTLGYARLSGAATSVHLHGPANANSVADILVDFDTLPAPSELILAETGSGTGRIDLTQAITATVSGDSLVVLLQKGLLYVDLHTSANPAGEIRGNVREN
jgi:hypothetical protein